MYCPNCKREVGTKRVLDGNHVAVSLLIWVGGLIVLAGLGLAITAPGFLLVIAFFIWQNSPRVCPLCRTRLFNALVGDEKGVYASQDDAKQGIASFRLCGKCRAQNGSEAIYCSKCGHCF